MRTPSPGLSAPSIRSVCRLSVFLKPAVPAAPICFGPLMGVMKTTVLPLCSVLRRATMNSMLTSPAASSLSFAASAPGRSGMEVTHVSTRSDFIINFRLLVVGFFSRHVGAVYRSVGRRERAGKHTLASPRMGVSRLPSSKLNSYFAAEQIP